MLLPSCWSGDLDCISAWGARWGVASRAAAGRHDAVIGAAATYRECRLQERPRPATPPRHDDRVAHRHHISGRVLGLPGWYELALPSRCSRCCSVMLTLSMRGSVWCACSGGHLERSTVAELEASVFRECSDRKGLLADPVKFAHDSCCSTLRY